MAVASKSLGDYHELVKTFLIQSWEIVVPISWTYSTHTCAKAEGVEGQFECCIDMNLEFGKSLDRLLEYNGQRDENYPFDAVKL